MSAGAEQIARGPYRLSIDDLLAGGFREGQPAPEDGFDRVFWHCARDQYGKKWVVAVRFWGFSKYSTPDSAVEDGFDFELCLKDDMGGWFRVTRSVREWVPKGIIGHCEWLWRTLDCDYLERFEE